MNKRKNTVRDRTETMMVDQLINARSMCIVAGCVETYRGDQPAGWQNLLSYHSTRPEMCDWKHEDWLNKPYRDFVVCPKHVHEIGKLFKIPLAVTETDVNVSVMAVQPDWNKLYEMFPDEQPSNTIH